MVTSTPRRKAARPRGTHEAVVSLRPCASYEPDRVEDQLTEALEPFGGIEGLVKPGERVLIKINLLNDTPPEHAVVTHPSLTRALIRKVRSAGAIPVVGDQSGPGLKGITMRAFRASGTWDVCEQEGAEALPFNKHGFTEIQCPENTHLKSLFVARDVLEADRVIGIAKLKTHMQALYTGAVKNYFGCIPLRERKRAHLLSKFRLFCEGLVDIFAAVDPDFTLIDGVIGMEGMGPNRGAPKKTGVILAARDHVACDAVALDLMGIPGEAYPVLAAAQARGLGQGRLERIDIVGGDPSRFRSAYRLPPRYLRNPPRMIASLATMVSSGTRPVVDEERCQACGACFESCPAGAITLRPKAAIDPRRCIQCLCCMELCPHEAVYEKAPALVSALRRVRNAVIRPTR